MTILATKSTSRPFAVLPDWRVLARLPEAELAGVDIVVMNLACAAGLPGWEKIDTELCIRTLGDWAKKARAFTDKWRPHFEQDPVRYGNSEGFFQILAMVTLLQRELGVLYNPLKEAEDAPFDLEDTFVHGIVQGNGGTCATMPVVYAAVGRRLGYPIRLATVWANHNAGHLLARWDDGEERFNIEASGSGLNTPPDYYYRRGRYEMTPEIERLGCYLQSMTPRTELALFLAQRAICWEEVGNFRGELEAWAWARALHPENAILDNTLKSRMNAWAQSHRERKPRQFPAKTFIKPPPVRLWPETLPLEYERNLLGLMAEECFLRDPELAPVWERMRRGEWNRPFADAITATFFGDGSCQITPR